MYKTNRKSLNQTNRYNNKVKLKRYAFLQPNKRIKLTINYVDVCFMLCVLNVHRVHQLSQSYTQK